MTEWLCTFEYNKPLAQTCHMVRVRDEQHSHAHTILCTLVRMYSFTVDLDLRGCHTELTLSWLLVTEILLLTSTGSSLTYHVNGHTSPWPGSSNHHYGLSSAILCLPQPLMELSWVCLLFTCTVLLAYTVVYPFDLAKSKLYLGTLSSGVCNCTYISHSKMKLVSHLL